MKRSSGKPVLVLFCACAAPCMAAITLTPADLQPPADISWNTNDLVGIAGTTRELRIMDEQTQWADFNWLLLDSQNDGFPGGISTSSNDTTVFIPANGTGNVFTLLIPAGSNFALFNDPDDGSGSKGTGPNGVLNSLDSYLSSNIARNQTTLSSSQFVKYYLADPTQDYEFTVHDQTTNLGHGCVAFIFIDDDHIGANFDYNDMIVCIRGCSTSAECQDGVFCNGQETCVNGQCAAGTPVNCNDGIPCTVDVCLEQSHTCMNKPHNGLCSDGVFCNGVEQCDPARGCVPDPFPPSCDDGVPCTTDTCNESTHACDHTPNDARCDDGIFCNGKEICHPLLNCEPGSPVNCDDGIACTADSCDEAAKTCDHTPNNSLCDDGVFCNGIEICDVHNGCTAGPPFNCSDGVGCTDDLCVEATHTCTHTPNNSHCDDGQFCDGVETCDPVNGCQVGPPPNCADKVTCTHDLCDESIHACRHVVDNSLCDDGVFCNGVELCDPKVGCHAGTPPNCNDKVPCTVDACNEATHSCTHMPNNSTCSDGLFCNGLEFCDIVKGCQPGTPPCPAPLTCLEDQDTCVSCATDAQCNDGVFCNGVETCVNNQCVPGTPPNCADAIPCTTDLCDPGTDACIHVPNDASCSNGLFCDGNEVCNSQTGCQPGTPVNCDDHIACTVDACSEAQHACTHTPNHASCSNGLFCDGDEVCNPTQGCVPGAPPNCNDGIACTKDLCNEAADRCDHIPISSFCDDELFCNGVELCDVVHGCIPGPPVDCSDGVACTLDTCV